MFLNASTCLLCLLVEEAATASSQHQTSMPKTFSRSHNCSQRPAIASSYRNPQIHSRYPDIYQPSSDASKLLPSPSHPLPRNGVTGLHITASFRLWWGALPTDTIPARGQKNLDWLSTDLYIHQAELYTRRVCLSGGGKVQLVYSCVRICTTERFLASSNSKAETDSDSRRNTSSVLGATRAAYNAR